MLSHDMEGIEVYRGRVQDDWIDINQHMNVAYYVLAFDLAIDTLWSRFGVTPDYISSGEGTTFAVESHVLYKREMNLDDPFIVTTQILGYDEKRIHQFMRMYHANEGFLAATSEWMNLHVDLRSRKVAPWPESIAANIAAVAGEQGDCPYPSEAGHQMSLKSRHTQRDRPGEQK